jgi:hypothetical protein
MPVGRLRAWLGYSHGVPSAPPSPTHPDHTATAAGAASTSSGQERTTPRPATRRLRRGILPVNRGGTGSLVTDVTRAGSARDQISR